MEKIINFIKLITQDSNGLEDIQAFNRMVEQTNDRIASEKLLTNEEIESRNENFGIFINVS